MSIADHTVIALRDAAITLAAERAREYAAIHRLSCRYKVRDLVCSTCHDLDARSVRLAKLAGTMA
jgi:hypothetical protein